MKKCRLGCEGDTQLFVMDRCSKQVLGELSGGLSFLKYGRELDDDSECEATVRFRSDSAGEACCEVLSRARTWRNELYVVRDSEVVWQGPIVNLSFQRDIGHILARDIVAWLDHRVVHETYEFVDVDLTTIALTCIEDAVLAHNDICVLEYIQSSPAGVTRTMTVNAKQRTAGEVLRELAAAGLDFTVVGRSLVLGGGFAFGPIGPLFDEHFLGDVEVEERGLGAVTKQYMPGRDVAGGAIGECGGADPFYGLLESAVETFSQSEDVDFLNRTACQRVAARNPPPLHVSIPDGAALSPDAPVCPELLVPGTLVDVDIRNLCRRATARHRLTAVRFRLDEKGEEVGITVAPYGPGLEDLEAEL